MSESDDVRPDRCDSCRFWEPDEGEDKRRYHRDDFPGHCRRFPRTLNVIAVLSDYRRDRERVWPNYDYHWSLPIMRGCEWCGEWKPKPSAPFPDRHVVEMPLAPGENPQPGDFVSLDSFGRVRKLTCRHDST